RRHGGRDRDRAAGVRGRPLSRADRSRAVPEPRRASRRRGRQYGDLPPARRSRRRIASVLTPEQAKERLEAQRDAAMLPAREEAVARLPAMQRAVGEALLDGRAYFGRVPGEPRAAIPTFDAAAGKARPRLLVALFRDLAEHFERWWQLGKGQPYQGGWSRRAFRAPRNPARSRERRFGELAMVVGPLAAYDPDPVWIAQWAAHIGWG